MGQSLSALCAASLQNGSSVRSLHSLSEAVLLFSLTLFRLVSSEHLLHLLKVLIGSVLHDSNVSNRNGKTAIFTLLHNDILYYTR